MLTDDLAKGDPAAVRALDEVVRGELLGRTLVRVKVWSTTGRVLYADEPRLVGRTFQLSPDERDALRDGRPRAEVTELSNPENGFERQRGRLLEVYRRVTTTPSGTPMLFETYSPYDEVSARTQRLWFGFTGLLVGTLLLLVLLLVPVVWRVQDRIRRSHARREGLLRRASFVLAGSVERARREGSPELAEQLRATAATVRGSIGGLRSLLMDIYPPSLASAGLAVVLQDLAGPLRSRDVAVELDLPAAADPLLDVVDDGVGFDAATVTAGPPEGHLGLRVMADLAHEAGAILAVSSAPEEGTWWQLRIRAS